MALVRLYNLLLGVTLCLASVLAIDAMIYAMSRYPEEPEDVWLLAFWSTVLALLAALCLTNGLLRRSASSIWLRCVNFLGLAAIFFLVIIGQQDPVVLIAGTIVVLGLLPALIVSTAPDA